MPQVSVTINGRSYRMACGEGEEDRLIALADEFNEYVTGLKGNFGEIGDQRLTVMAAIMVVDEFRETRKKLEALKTEMESLRTERQSDSQVRDEAERKLAVGLEEAADRIEQISRELNATVRNAST